MTIVRGIFVFFLMAFLAILQTTAIIPVMGGVYVDFLLIASVFLVRTHARGYFLLIVFLSTLYVDVVSYSPLGLSTFWYCLAVYVIIRLRESVYHYSLMSNYTIFFVAAISKLVYITLVASILRLFSYTLPLFTWEDLISTGFSIACMTFLCALVYLSRILINRGQYNET